MGWVVLYIAFGCVALWLLSEVLLQYKARLRWRLLAFTGFLGVVVGVVIPSVIVIAAGAIAFAVGQTYVTLSFRSGFQSGWALRGKRGDGGKRGDSGKRGDNRRRRAKGGGRAAAAGPTLQVSGLEAVPATEEADAGAVVGGTPPTGTAAFDGAAAFDGTDPFAGVESTPNGYGGGDSTEVYAPQPIPEETGQYGIYSPDARSEQPGYAAYDGYGGYGQDTYGYDGGYVAAAQAGQDAYPDHYSAYGADPGHGQGQSHGQGQGHGQDGLHGQEQGGQAPYAAPYTDPYAGGQQYAAQYDPYDQPDAFGGTQAYPAQQYTGVQDPSQAQPSYGDTPPGGVWVPQQRGTEPTADQPHPPYQPPQNQGYDGQQYRY
ncbi:hypothetical protein OEIGOIKO_06149 [Streptomyces chrestomyceticus JCM 4735]|uniref:Uncharacterized protein n=1 Tax=Streptomyces chrestomyceticus JCM 4735 TaxID=1306181 RepID=A0A7U9KZL9_9ACTN|nr:hypothetical protein [Streptomyces chrestomyceticus]GCD38336.1 hypothetical protein OEIGOIKO_06149 [Streptomyces chrestomyceticus JCM 4735]